MLQMQRYSLGNDAVIVGITPILQNYSIRNLTENVTIELLLRKQEKMDD